jgi:hypothetical protein
MSGTLDVVRSLPTEQRSRWKEFELVQFSDGAGSAIKPVAMFGQVQEMVCSKRVHS